MSASKPASCSCNGLRVSPYRLKIFRPLFASVLSPTFSSSSPYSPCSGLKRALSCTRSDLSRKSSVDLRSRSWPVWLVIKPMRLPFGNNSGRIRSTSAPLRTDCRAVNSGGAALPVEKPCNASAASVATVRLSAMTFPRPSGCVRLVIRMTEVPVAGSIHNEQPVQPVCP